MRVRAHSLWSVPQLMVYCDAQRVLERGGLPCCRPVPGRGGSVVWHGERLRRRSAPTASVVYDVR